MADSLQRAQLARLAQRFRRVAATRLPALVFFTDDRRLPDPLPSICALPRGSMVVLRHRNVAKRHALAGDVSRVARERELIWLVADDPHLAAVMRAHGVHFPEAKIVHAPHWRGKRPRWIITCAAHSLAACTQASRAGVNAIFLAPVFATQSHPGRTCLGPLRARMITESVATPIYALGGIDAHTARRLTGGRFSGLAAIGALAVDGERR